MLGGLVLAFSVGRVQAESPADGNLAGAASGGCVVKVARTNEGYTLLRNGEPYVIKGAGGRSRMEALKAAGGNSLRTWRPNRLRPSLDQAHELGLTMTVGLWMGHERHGHSYDDPAFVQRMHDAARAAVLELKDHPAVLMWGIGNEMEGDGRNPKVWQAVNDIARMIKSIDPNHPCMTVIAGTGHGKVRRFVEHCPDIDVLGVNAYGDLSRIPDALARQGWDKPYVITEFGPYGWWQREETSWGAELEPTSTQKAATYLESYQAAVLAQPHSCFGAYAFLWGDKQEHTHTWFGMFLPTGERTAAVDAMTKVWTGAWPANRAPEIRDLTVTRADGPASGHPDEQSHGQVEAARHGPAEEAGDGTPQSKAGGTTEGGGNGAAKRPEHIYPPGTRLVCRVDAGDPNGDPLRIKWEVWAESTDKREGGDREEIPAQYPDAVVEAKGPEATVVLPERAGGYRVFVYVFDDEDYAATANVPVRVR